MANLNMARLSAYPVFLAVYEERRLVKAAERLCVTPSAVSHALRDFEQSLGTKLFERTSEGVQPTTAGQRLYAKVKPLVVGIEAAERELRSETAPEQTDFAFASIHTFIKAFFVPILERMQKDDEPVKVRFLTRSMAGTVRAVADDEALIGSTMLPLERPERFYVVPLTEIREYFVVSPAYFDALQSKRDQPREPWTLEEIVQQPLITLPRDSVSFAGYNRHFRQYGLHLEPRYEVHQEDLGFDLAGRGLGIFIGFNPALFGHPELKILSCHSTLPARELVLFCRKERADDATRRLMDRIGGEFVALFRELKRGIG